MPGQTAFRACVGSHRCSELLKGVDGKVLNKVVRPARNVNDGRRTFDSTSALSLSKVDLVSGFPALDFED